MVEHLPVKEIVVGSNPTAGAIRLASLAHGFQPQRSVANVPSVVEGIMYTVYIIRTENNKLYIGHTNNLKRREAEHKWHHEGAKFLRDADQTFAVAHTEEYPTRQEAMKREKQLKSWSRAKKEALINKNIDLLKKL